MSKSTFHSNCSKSKKPSIRDQDPKTMKTIQAARDLRNDIAAKCAASCHSSAMQKSDWHRESVVENPRGLLHHLDLQEKFSGDLCEGPLKVKLAAQSAAHPGASSKIHQNSNQSPSFSRFEKLWPVLGRAVLVMLAAQAWDPDLAASGQRSGDQSPGRPGRLADSTTICWAPKCLGLR